MDMFAMNVTFTFHLVNCVYKITTATMHDHELQADIVLFRLQPRRDTTTTRMAYTTLLMQPQTDLWSSPMLPENAMNMLWYSQPPSYTVAPETVTSNFPV